MRCTTFRAISGDYLLSDISVVGAAGTGDVCAQTIGADGSWNGQYYYLTMEGTGWLEDGWYLEDQATPATDVILNQGTAMMIQSTENAVTFVVNGQVHTGTATITAEVGDSMIGNCLPKSVNLTDIAVSGAAGTGDVCVQTIAPSGEWNGQYYYLTMDGTGWLEDGWYLEDQATPATDVILNAGDSMMLTTSENAITLTLPAAL